MRVLRFAFFQYGPSTGLLVRYVALRSPIVLLNHSERRRFCRLFKETREVAWRISRISSQKNGPRS